MVLDFNEDIYNNLIRNIVEPFIEILHSSLMMLLENFEFRVLFVKF